MITSSAPISHKNVCAIMQYENTLMAVYQKALRDRERCPQEWVEIVRIECDEIRQDLASVLN